MVTNIELNCGNVIFFSVKLKHFKKFKDTTEALAGELRDLQISLKYFV